AMRGNGHWRRRCFHERMSVGQRVRIPPAKGEAVRAGSQSCNNPHGSCGTLPKILCDGQRGGVTYVTRSPMGSALHVMLFLENLLQALWIFTGGRSCHRQRAFLVFTPYPGAYGGRPPPARRGRPEAPPQS